MLKTLKKRFDLKVVEPNSLVVKTFELDKNIKYVLGILISSDRDDLLYYRGSQKIELNKEEFFPEGYESKLLMSGINIAPKSRYYDLDKVPAGVGSLKVSYLDTENPFMGFEPYRVSIYVDCEIE